MIVDRAVLARTSRSTHFASSGAVLAFVDASQRELIAFASYTQGLIVLSLESILFIAGDAVSSGVTSEAAFRAGLTLISSTFRVGVVDTLSAEGVAVVGTLEGVAEASTTIHANSGRRALSTSL